MFGLKIFSVVEVLKSYHGAYSPSTLSISTFYMTLFQGRENETEQARQRRILADRERKRLARSCETLEMKMKRNEADKIRKRLVGVLN